MQRNMFKSKIHRATVTESNVDYEGSVTVDQDLLDLADMVPWEQVHVWDVDNGARLTTYLLAGPRGKGTVCINGAAAHLVKPGHRVILATFANVDENKVHNYRPKVVLVDKNNQPFETDYQEQPFRPSPLI
jgi:aspartate 1-decarboxylase